MASKYLYSGPTTIVEISGKPVTLANGEEYEVPEGELEGLKRRDFLTLVEVPATELKAAPRKTTKEATA